MANAPASAPTTLPSSTGSPTYLPVRPVPSRPSTITITRTCASHPICSMPAATSQRPQLRRTAGPHPGPSSRTYHPPWPSHAPMDRAHPPSLPITVSRTTNHESRTHRPPRASHSMQAASPISHRASCIVHRTSRICINAHPRALADELSPPHRLADPHSRSSIRQAPEPALTGHRAIQLYDRASPVPVAVNDSPHSAHPLTQPTHLIPDPLCPSPPPPPSPHILSPNPSLECIALPKALHI
ncbi:hypothetical protein C8Q78DRAFT_834147 [Trametes maxima]|nr:hypothetical protein C8Q78DRAFT_834147 [Trametes maxima]